MPYRGGTKEWSNRYFMTGGNWTGLAEFEDIADWLAGNEAFCYGAKSVQKEAVAYGIGSDLPVFSKTLTEAGQSLPGSAHSAAPGDAAAFLRFTTDRRSVKNHPIYLSKWYHSCWIDEAVSEDQLHGDNRQAIVAFANALLAGIQAGDHTRKLCGPYGAVAQQQSVDQYVRHRDFVS